MPESQPVVLSYPGAERTDTVEELHGRRVPDPYRWLEDPADPRTTSWSDAQDMLARPWLDALPGRASLAGRMRTLLSAGSVSTPVWRANRAFFTRRGADEEHPVLYVREHDEVTGETTERVLLDVTALDPSGLTTLDGWSPSREGELLAYRRSVGGNEESELLVLDVRTGEHVEGPIDRCRSSSVAWLPGGAGYFYVRRLPPEEVPADERQFHRRVWRHEVGTDAAQDVLIHGAGLHHTYFYGVQVSHDGRWLLVQGSPGTSRKDSLWIADLAETSAVPRLQRIVHIDDDIRASAWVERDGRMYVLTTWNAPRWRLCVTDPQRPGRENWTELIAAEPDSVLEAVRWLDGTEDRPARLAVLRTRHAVSEVALHDPATGVRTAPVPLPGAEGQVTSLSTVDVDTTRHRGLLWIGWTDFTTPSSVQTYSPSTGKTMLAEQAPGADRLPDPRTVHTRQVSYKSADGTTVRMFLLTPSERPAYPRPAILTGYGGFAISEEPGYAPSALAWVSAGGVWALPSLRGGAEEGEQWHLAGMRENKQNVFDDFHAAAEYLIAQGWTTADQLAISGGSNGGLLVGAALTQRPELYRAVVCSAPLLDMVRYERFLLGRAWSEEYGSADDPEELGWLLSYSPYHRVLAGDRIAYPSVLFTVFESDSRVDPSHARKMCAALQAATRSDPAQRPVLLRRETQVGHSACSVSRTVTLAIDQLAFLAQATGLPLK